MKDNPLCAFHVANSLTYLSLICGVAAVGSAAAGKAPLAGALIAGSVFADTFDGTFARRFSRSRAQCEIGVQLDSLSDAIAFGATPALCMTLLASRESGQMQLAWWIAVAAFSVCAITRLAFYNVTHDETAGFVVLPAPVAALLWSSALLAHPGPWTSTVILMATAAAMVLPLRIPRPRGVALAVFAVWPVTVIAAHLLRGWTS